MVETSAPAAVAEPATRDRIWRRVLLLVLVWRVLLQAVGVVATAGRQDLASAGLGLWNHWDAPHYLRLAEVWYPASGHDALFIVFFPGYPLIVRLVALVLRSFLVSGLVVSTLASVVAGVALYRLARQDTEHAQAWRTVVLLFSFPTAYFLAAPYTEATFLAFVVGSVLLVRTQRWAKGSLAAALGAATRVAGIALVPALAVEAMRSRTRRLRRLAWTALAPAGLLAYIVLNWSVYGDPLHFLEVQRDHWFQHWVPPWTPLVDSVRAIAEGMSGADDWLIHAGRIGGFVACVALLLTGARRLRAADQAYAWTGLLVVMSASWLISLPRYLLAIYPIFLVAGGLTRRRGVFLAVVIAGSTLQALLMFRYARGAWTF